MTTERRILLVAGGLIALHIADDSFLQPPPGTSAGDHLAAGLIPLGVIGVAAYVHGRAGAGARAVIALLVGLLGVTIGIEALYYSREIGPSGDDFTGLLSVPAGVALIGLGAFTLWRSRRLDERLVRRYPRRALIAFGALVASFLVLMPVVLSYSYTHLGRAVVPRADLGASYEEVTLETSDGLELEGWYVPSRNGAAVIAFPGRKGPQKHARMLIRHGYGVLLFDRRGEGASEGAPNAYGWDGDRDIQAAIGFLERRPDVEPGRIGGIGLSVGGELMLQTAAETGRLDAVVSDGAGSRSFSEDTAKVDGLGNVLALPQLATVYAGVRILSGSSSPPVLTELVPRIEAPLMIIHNDNELQEGLSNTYYDIAHSPKTELELDGVGHMSGITERPDLYERSVMRFLDRALLD